MIIYIMASWCDGDKSLVICQQNWLQHSVQCKRGTLGQYRDRVEIILVQIQIYNVFNHAAVMEFFLCAIMYKLLCK